MRFPILSTLATICVFALTVALTLRVYGVSGSSMAPSLEPGQIVIVDRVTYRLRPPHIGDIVVFHSPLDGKPAIKRVVGLDRERTLKLHGDNVGYSVDSRHYGPVQPEQILGRVIFVGRKR